MSVLNSGDLWTGHDFLAATGGRAVGTLPAVITGISIDSRTILPGEAFFAITGDRMDGHDFVASALGNHASVAVVEEGRLAALGDLTAAIAVDDVLAALNRLAAAARARSDARIIAVTGSVGKTSTKEMLRVALSAGGEVHASVASFNNHWGVPLTLSRLSPQAKTAVFEIGMNHAGEIVPLTSLVRPHIAIVTNVEPVHLEHFASVEEIADAKAEIFVGLEPGGVAILNADNQHFERLRAAAAGLDAQIRTFGEAEGADARLIAYRHLPDGAEVEADVAGRRVAYTLGAPGRHLVQNSLAVLLAAEHASIPAEVAAEALADFRPPAGRGQRHVLHVGGGRATLLDESYNANPASMRAAIELLGQTKARRRIAVLGDMLELGAEADAMHAALAGNLASADVDLVFCAGRHMKALHEALPQAMRAGWAPTSAEIADALAGAVRADDAIMIKGSHSSRMGPIVAALTARFATADTALA